LNASDASSLLPDLPRGAPILITRLRSLGDLVLETPAIAALHAWRPDLRIFILVEDRFAPAFENNPGVTAVLTARGFGDTAKTLRRERFPIAYNQHGGPRSAILTALSAAPVRVCWKNVQFSFLYNVLVPNPEEYYKNSSAHAAEHRISQFYFTGLPRGPIPRAQVFPGAPAVESARGMLVEAGIPKSTPYAVLQPEARSVSMRWPVAKFAQVARWLRETHGIASVVNSSETESELAAEVRRELGKCALVPHSPLPLRELIALIAGARLYVGNDSGPTHLAAAAGIPVVAIFGPTNWRQWRPWRTEHRVVSTGARFETIRGVAERFVSEERPIQTIAVEEVCKACEELLEDGCEIRGDDNDVKPSQA
jgi:ADP-heptose:LPS heptosyltransferase